MGDGKSRLRSANRFVTARQFRAVLSVGATSISGVSSSTNADKEVSNFVKEITRLSSCMPCSARDEAQRCEAAEDWIVECTRRQCFQPRE